ncbi:MAG: hypothetical protein ABJM70_00035 [Ekhidna sp.]
MFHDEITDERRCVSTTVTKTVDEDQTECTSTLTIGSNEVMKNNPTYYSIRSTDGVDESTATIDTDGISFDSNSVGVTFTSSAAQFRLYYDETVESLLVQKCVTNSWVTKKEYTS